MESQGLLFAEPSIAETGVWCSLSEGIDPARWAEVCRFIGTRSTNEFETIVKMVKGRESSNSVPIAAPKDIRMPLVSIGPSGIGGKYQWEWFG